MSKRSRAASTPGSGPRDRGFESAPRSGSGRGDQDSGETCILEVRIQPGASKTEVAGSYGDLPKIPIAAPPVEGAANKALVEFVAKAVGVSKTSVEILSGHSSRNKRLRIAGASLASVKKALDIEP